VSAPTADLAASPPATDLAVASTGLTKVFKARPAVDGIDLVVPSGSVYGFLGPNGSGKTTTIRMLVGLVRPTAGEYTLFGRRMPEASAAVLPRVGALIEGPAFHPYLSGRANLRRLDAADAFADPATSAARIDRALERVGLLVAADKRYRAYSLGMRQRLAIAAGLRQPRDLVILDEPTNGLDPQGTREIRALISGLHEAGTTVLVSSHLLSEVEQVCSHVGIMSSGRLVAQGPVEELRSGAGPARVHVVTDRRDDAVRVLTELGLAAPTATSDGVTAPLGDVAPEKIAPALVYAGVPVLGLRVERPSLEDVFVTLTGEGFDVNG
jgi:ABC-2 type transport system ATP-binding protein